MAKLTVKAQAGWHQHWQGGEHVDDKAITEAYGEAMIVDGSAWGRVTWREWCNKEIERLQKKDDFSVRIGQGFGRIWLTRT
ncbi:MAG: hypothetical protein PHR35_08610 [Kiritimatiellae bacterium]|nr:hypothetical protein [Kiritimatiellia bacterium]